MSEKLSAYGTMVKMRKTAAEFQATEEIMALSFK